MEQISKKKKILPVENRKSEYHYWVLYIGISLSTNFQLKLAIAIFGLNFPQKGSYFQSKTDKIDTTIKFFILKLVFVSNFTLNKQFWYFGSNLPKKVFPIKNWKSEHNHWIPHIQISLGTKFPLKLTILIFWTRFSQKGFSGLKQKKLTPHIFHIILHIQINLVQNFSSNWEFDFLDQICPKRYFQSKVEKVNISIFDLVYNHLQNIWDWL